MGKLALAAKITHVPSMYLSEFPGPNFGCRDAAKTASITSLASTLRGPSDWPAISPARPCRKTPRQAASNGRIPWPISEAIIPASTSPVPALLSELSPVVLR